MSVPSQKQFQWSTVYLKRIWLDCPAAADEHKESVFWCRKINRNFPCEFAIIRMKTNMPAFLKGLKVLILNDSHSSCQLVVL